MARSSASLVNMRRSVLMVSSSVVISTLLAARIPSLNHIALKATTINYKFKDESSGDAEKYVYGKGVDDIYIVIFLIFFLNVLREFVNSIIFAPVARLMKIRNPVKVHKFAEQGWSAAFYIASWCVGTYILLQSKWFPFDFKWIWENYPFVDLSYLEKVFYLWELAYWSHMILVTLVEEHRKDFIMMLAHHIFTCVLIGGSYAINITPMGNAILFTTDAADIFLPLAKMLKYAKVTTLLITSSRIDLCIT